MLTKSGSAPATKGTGALIRKDTAKTARVKVAIEGYDGFEFEAQRWWRHPTDSDSKVRSAPKEPDLPPGAQWVWNLSIEGLSICWHDTKPLAAQLAKEWIDNCGGPDWLARRLGWNWVEMTVGELAVDGEPDWDMVRR